MNLKITHWNAPKLEQVQITTLKCCIRMGASASCNAGILPNAGKYKFQHWKSCRIGAHVHYNTRLLKMQQVQDYRVGILHWYLAQV
jgi:hypothetical protein